MAIPSRSLPVFPDLSRLILRLGVGVVFLYHGSQKLFGMFDGPGIAGFMGYLQKLGVPNPEVSAYLAGGVEFFCGGAVLLGLWARLATIPLIINMGVAVALVHWQHGFNIVNKGFEYNFVLVSVLLALLLQGPGRWSLNPS